MTKFLKAFWQQAYAEELGYVLAKFTVHHHGAELISIGYGLAFRNTSWCDQALGAWR